jgi:hypothetical protein
MNFWNSSKHLRRHNTILGGGEGCRRVNMVKILCTHVFKWKLIPVETISEMRGR